MENEIRENIIEYEDENAFGPHEIKVLEYDNRIKIHHFFTLSYKGQDVSKNKIFIQWKKDMKKINDLIIHCPYCSAYFPHEAMDYCKCAKCGSNYCFGCYQLNCDSPRCFKWWKIILPFYGLKGYGDTNFLIKILIFIFMVIQALFTFPLQVLYKFGPRASGGFCPDTYEEYIEHRKKGLKLCFIMIPYQIAFFGFLFDLALIFFFLPSILYPPYSFYCMGALRYMQTHYHGQLYFQGNGEFIPL